MTKTAIPLTALLVLAAATLAPLTSAQDDRTDRDWRDEARALRLDRDADELTFVSERTSQLGDDRLDASYRLDTGRLEYRFTSFDEDDAGMRIAFAVEVVALVEFRDPTGRGYYTLNAETIHRYPVQDMDTRPLTSDSILQGRGYRASAEYDIPDPNNEDDPLGGTTGFGGGTFRLGFTMVETPRDVDGERLAPTQLHFEVGISDHRFAEPDSHLGLEFKALSSHAATYSRESGIDQRTDGFQSILGWDPNASVDGNERPASTTVFAVADGTDHQEYMLLASYPQSDDIGHSWSMQTNRLDLPDEIGQFLARGDALIFTGALLATLALAGWPVVNRLRER